MFLKNKSSFETEIIGQTLVGEHSQRIATKVNINSNLPAQLKDMIKCQMLAIQVEMIQMNS